MHRQRFATLSLLLALSQALCGSPVRAMEETVPPPGLDTAVPDSVAALLKRHKIPLADVSIYVRDVSGARPPVVSVNASVPRNPASVTKMLTTLAALEMLGPGYQWKTQAYRKGALERGVLKGDLAIKGFGDPYFTPESLWTFVRSLRDRGLRVIEGDVLLDDGYFAPPQAERGDFDGRPDRAYNALPYALSLNFQATRINLVPDRTSNLIRVFSEPTLANLDIQNRLKPVAGPCRGAQARPQLRVSNDVQSATVIVSGKLSVRCNDMSYTRLVMDPSDHLGGAFRTLWKEAGGTLQGDVERGDTPPQAHWVYTQLSRPLGETIRGMNKYSNNLMSRLLFLTLGAEAHGAPGTLDKGRRAVTEWLEGTGISMPELFVENGAGLSRMARISAEHMGELLRFAYMTPVMPEFMSSLSILGVDGTLRKRFPKSPLSGRVHAKTGSLNFVSALGGYVLDRRSRRLVVVLFLNGRSVASWKGRQVQNALMKWVYDGVRSGVQVADHAG